MVMAWGRYKLWVTFANISFHCNFAEISRKVSVCGQAVTKVFAQILKFLQEKVLCHLPSGLPEANHNRNTSIQWNSQAFQAFMAEYCLKNGRLNKEPPTNTSWHPSWVRCCSGNEGSLRKIHLRASNVALIYLRLSFYILFIFAAFTTSIICLCNVDSKFQYSREANEKLRLSSKA